MTESTTQDIPPEDADAEAPEPPSMHKKAVKGTFWSVLGQIVKNLLRLGSNVLLTRLLTAEDYAISTLVNTVIIGLEMVSDIGIEASIIQSDKGEEESFLDTAFTAQVLRGLVLFLFACLLAWPAAIFFDSEPLKTLLPVAGLGALIRGFWPTRLHLLRRHLEVKKLVSLDVAAQATAVVFMAIHAYIYRSVWALILGALIIFATPAVLSVFIPGHKNRFRWQPDAVQELIGFGKWIFVSTLITYFANYFNIFASGRLVDKATLGVYGISNMLAMLPLVVGGHATNAVLLPALAATAREDRSKLAGAFARAQRVILPALLFATMGLVLLSPAFFFLLYKEDYHDAGWMVQLTMIGTWFYYKHDSWSRALLAIGVSRPLAVSNFVKLLGTAGCALLGFHLLAFPGLLLGGAFGAFLGYLSIAFALTKEDIPVWGPDITYGVGGALICGAGVLLPQWIAPYVGYDWRLVSIPTSLLFLVPTGLFGARGLLREIRNR